MGTMRILSESGDTIVDWRIDDPESVTNAKREFDLLAAHRQIAFARPANASVEEAERIHAFDAFAEEIIWIRPIAGG